MAHPTPRRDDREADWRLSLGASPEVAGPGGVRLPLSRRDAALLAWFAIEGPTARSRIVELFWPDSDPEAARNTLRQRLFQLRRSVGTELVTGSTTLALADGVIHDLDDVETLLGDRPFEYGVEFEAWLERQRLRFDGRRHESLVELARAAEGDRDYPRALTHAIDLLKLQPLFEHSHRRVMRLHYLAGDHDAALLAFDRCEQTLKDEVGARPSAETREMRNTVEASRLAVSINLLDSPSTIDRSRPDPAGVQLQHGRRLATLSSSALNLARCLAIAERDLDDALAMQLLELGAGELAAAWQELEVGEFVRGGEFVLESVGDAVRASTPTVIARQLHAEIADHLEAGSAAAARIEHHRGRA